MYESIYEPINAVRPPSELSSTYSMSSLSQSIATREHETEVDSLTDLLVNSMSVNDGKKSLDSNASVLDCKYISSKHLSSLLMTIINYLCNFIYIFRELY